MALIIFPPTKTQSGYCKFDPNSEKRAFMNHLQTVRYTHQDFLQWQTPEQAARTKQVIADFHGHLTENLLQALTPEQAERAKKYFPRAFDKGYISEWNFGFCWCGNGAQLEYFLNEVLQCDYSGPNDKESKKRVFGALWLYFDGLILFPRLTIPPANMDGDEIEAIRKDVFFD